MAYADPQRSNDYTAFSGGTLPVNAQRWNATVAIGPNFQGMGGLTVADGTVFIGGSNGVLALDASTGAQKWQVPSGAMVICSVPAVSNGVVYVGTLYNEVYAFNAASGTQLWNFTGERGISNSNPAVANGLVYVMGGNGTAYGIYANNGTQKWAQKVATAPDWYSSECHPVVGGSNVYVVSYKPGTSDYKTSALDARTGAKLWDVPYAVMKYADSKLFALGGTVLDAANGNVLFTIPGSIGAVSQGIAYGTVSSIVGSEARQQLAAWDATNGVRKWIWPNSVAEVTVRAVADGVIYADVGEESSNGPHYLGAYDAASGALNWQFALNSRMHTMNAVVSHGSVYAATYAGQKVYAIGNPGWGPWKSLGGQLLPGTGPAASNWGSSRTDWFVIGNNHALYHSWTGHSGWENLGGYLTSSPAATSTGTGVIDIYARGNNGALWTRHYDGSWGPWTSLGGQIPTGTSPAAAAGYSAGRIDLFVQGMNGALWQNTWTGSWSGWTSLGGGITSSAAASSPGSGTIDVFARGKDGALWWRTGT